MALFKKLFGKKNVSEAKTPTLEWIEASKNPWGIQLLDLRPITQVMLSTSKDPQMAANAVSYHADDGIVFLTQEPPTLHEIKADLTFAVDPMLAPGVLFIPQVMEHKWAIFFHQHKIMFVRSWLRKVAVIAETIQHGGQLHIHKIRGQFSDETTAEFTQAIAKFLLISHAIGEVFPAPLPSELFDDHESVGLWAMSLYGKMAHVGTFSASFAGTTKSPIRSHSVLHIAVARKQINDIERHLEHGIPIDILAADGLAPLHWSLASDDTHVMQHLLTLGADPNVRSCEGATPLMNAVQSNSATHVHLLLSSGADVNACDHRGFTALHRAAEMGHSEIVEMLLHNGANPSIEAEGHTPLSLAELRGEENIMNLLQ